MSDEKPIIYLSDVRKFIQGLPDDTIVTRDGTPDHRSTTNGVTVNQLNLLPLMDLLERDKAKG